jgi:hypothetical protein
MRKILVVLLLVCAFGLLAQIPAGTKSIAVANVFVGSAEYGMDLLADDIAYGANLNVGYFIMDALEIDAILGLMGTTIEGDDLDWKVGLGVLYHFPLSPMFGLYGGAAFTYASPMDGMMAIPIEAGIEVFITQNNALRVADVFTVNLEDGVDNTDVVNIGAVHYFQ